MKLVSLLVLSSYMAKLVSKESGQVMQRHMGMKRVKQSTLFSEPLIEIISIRLNLLWAATLTLPEAVVDEQR
jgi:hypothetical protein